MSEYKKEFTFDLKVKELKAAFGGSYSKGYDQLYVFFVKKHCFEHRQGSVYCSKEPMSSPAVVDEKGVSVYRKIWILKCSRNTFPFNLPI